MIAYLPERSEFEIIQHRNVKDVQEITPLRGYSPPFNAFKSSKNGFTMKRKATAILMNGINRRTADFCAVLDDKSYYHRFTAIKFAKPS